MLHGVYSSVRNQWAGFLALFVALGGSAAAIGGVGDKQPERVVNAEGEIQACYDRKGSNRGEVRLLVKGKCTRAERKILWSQQGPVGPAGPATGPAGGDLAGNYPDPQIVPGAVTEAELGCGDDPDQQMVKVGSFCIDKYEASVWDSPSGGTQLTTEAQIDAACPENGQPTGPAPCTNFYARSVPGVEPAHDITYFQAQQALANSGKQLPTNAEWQQAVSGTPDSTACNVSTGLVASTGANADCLSRFGAFDMVGNLSEWVGDWDEHADGCALLPAGYGSDDSCFGDGSPSRFPGALIRGGTFDGGTFAGPFAANASAQPSLSFAFIGFRGAR